MQPLLTSDRHELGPVRAVDADDALPVGERRQLVGEPGQAVGVRPVALLAAVDPRRYPVVAVTSEPDGAEVLRGRVRLL